MTVRKLNLDCARLNLEAPFSTAKTDLQEMFLTDIAIF